MDPSACSPYPLVLKGKCIETKQASRKHRDPIERLIKEAVVSGRGVALGVQVAVLVVQS